MSVPILITMQGQLPGPPYSVVVWTVYNTPDNNGTYSGYGAGVLMNIGVTAVAAVGSPVNPLTLTVGGDLTGSLPNPSVSGIQGQPVAATAPTVGQTLAFDGTTWQPVPPPTVYFVSFKVTAGAPDPWATNWPGSGVTVVGQATGKYLATIPGAEISDSGAWTNIANADADPDGFMTQAIPLAPGQPTQVIVTCWDSLDALAADPTNPDTIISLFWFG